MLSRLCSSVLLIPASVLIFILAVPSAATAQVRDVTLEELRQELAPGDHISVVRTNGESTKGKLVRVGDNDVGVEVRTATLDEQFSIPFSAIRSLERLRDPAGNGAAIGAGIGAGVGATAFLIAMAKDANESDEWGAGYLAFGAVTTGIGAVAGWLVDLAQSKPGIRYSTPSNAALKIRVAPLLASRERGVKVWISF